MELTAGEIKRANEAAMGRELGAMFSELWQELNRISGDWKEFESLYGHSAERIDLLNRAAGHFFRTVQDGLWERTLLNIARITDAAETLGRRNLSLLGLALVITDPQLRQAVDSSVSIAQTKCKFAKDWRNRHIAHADLALALDPKAKPLKPASRLKVNEALSSIQDVLNTVSLSLRGSTTEFDEIVLTHSAENLVCLIDYGLRKKDERSKRIESGTYTEDDLAELRKLPS